MSTVTVIDLVEENGFRLLQGEDLNTVINSLNTNCLNVRIHTGASDITVGPNDYTILVNKNIGSTTNIFLPNVVVNSEGVLTLYIGRRFQIKDMKGDANSNPIIVVPPPPLLIDSLPSFSMVFAHESIDLVYNGQGFSIL